MSVDRHPSARFPHRVLTNRLFWYRVFFVSLCVLCVKILCVLCAFALNQRGFTDAKPHAPFRHLLGDHPRRHGVLGLRGNALRAGCRGPVAWFVGGNRPETPRHRLGHCRLGLRHLLLLD